MSIKIKLAEKKMRRISKKLDKYDKAFYAQQRKLRDLYKKETEEDIYDDAAQMEADRVALEAWKDGVVIKEEKND